jgi:hypothetical protein
VDQIGILRSHPLDLAFVFPDSDEAEFRIEHAVLPEVFYDPIAFEEKLSISFSDMDGALNNPRFSGDSTMRAYLAFRCIDGTGSAYGVSEIMTDTRHTCTNIRVHSNP